MSEGLRDRLEQMGLRKVGSFALSSGGQSNIFWDVERLFYYPHWMRIKAIEEFIWQVGMCKAALLIGIKTVGYDLAKDIGQALKIQFLGDHYYCIGKDCPRTVIVDGVLTTGTTVRKVLGYNTMATHIAVLVNRSNLTEIDGIPIVSGIIADKVE